MKALLFVPQEYSLAEMLLEGFELNGWNASIVDYKKIIPRRINRFYEKTLSLPKKITKHWNKKYFNRINKAYVEYFEREKPDLVLIYNNQFFFPETIDKIKKHSKIVFFLGDNPLWSRTFDFNLAILKHANLVISPDSSWQFELTSIGIPNVVCDYIGYSKKHFFPSDEIPEAIKQKYDCDLLFIGRNYGDSSGYKRTQFLSSFEGMNMKIFGSEEIWYKWLNFFPELNKHFSLVTSRISNEELNYAMNCAKIYPVDQNTGIVNGIHLRVFETIGAGTLPIVEWRKDIDTVFGDLLPSFKKYSEAKSIAETFLNNESLRKHTITKLREHIDSNYTPKLFVERIISKSR